MSLLHKKTNEYLDTVLLALEIPRTNDKKELAAEQMLAALHGILRPRRELRSMGQSQEHLSLEMSAIGSRIRFYIHTPRHLQAFVELIEEHGAFEAVVLGEHLRQHGQRLFAAVFLIGGDEEEVLPLAGAVTPRIGDPQRAFGNRMILSPQTAVRHRGNHQN